MQKGALHVHSTYSDGEFSLAELRKLFTAAGCDFVCMTDHAEAFTSARLAAYVDECKSLSDDRFTFIPGLEYECDKRMHILGYGVVTRAGSTLPESVIQHIERQGGVSAIAHPKDEFFGWIESFRVLPSAIECWNSKYDGRYGPRPETFRLLESLRARKPSMVAVFGQDLHWRKQYRGLFTVLDQPVRSRGALLEALSSGRYSGHAGELSLPSSGVLPASMLHRLGARHARAEYFRRFAKTTKRLADKLGDQDASRIEIAVTKGFLMVAGVFILMYHELGMPGRQPCELGPGYTRYVVAGADFREQLTCIKTLGFAGKSVGAINEQPGCRQLAITFDDGCETDLRVAAPILQTMNFGATFYALSGFIGRKGYLSRSQLRELADAGFEIGSHSVTHRLLTMLADREIQTELADSKKDLEDITGKQINHFSCPRGGWDLRVASLAREAGYRTVATSRIGSYTHGKDGLFSLPRIPMLQQNSVENLYQLLADKGLLLRRTQALAVRLVRRGLGEHLYDRLRTGVLSCRCYISNR